MLLLTKELETRFATIGCQDGKGDEAIVITKFFTPDSCWTWLATEYDPESRTFFGYVLGHEHEWGYFTLEELESTKGPLGLHIERDLYFTEQTVRQTRQQIGGHRREQLQHRDHQSQTERLRQHP